MTDPRYHSSVTDPDETAPISASQLAELREGSDGHDPAPRGDRTVAGGPDRGAPGSSGPTRPPTARDSGSVPASSVDRGADRSADRGSSRGTPNGSPPGSPSAPGSAGWYDQQRYTARPGDPRDAGREAPTRGGGNGQNGYPSGYPTPGTGSARDAGPGARPTAGPAATPGSGGRSARPGGPPTTGSTPAAGSRGRSGADSPYAPSSGSGYGSTGYPSGSTPAAGSTSSPYGGTSAGYGSSGAAGAGFSGSNEATSYAPGGYTGGYGPSSYTSTIGRDLESTGSGMAVGGAAGAVGGSFVGGSTLGTSPSRRPAPGRQARGGAAGRPARRARLMIKQIDPWSTFKFSLVLAVAMFFVWLVAIGVLYGVLDGIGVFNKINDLYSQLSGSDGKQIVTPGLVLGLAALVGAVNIVLTTALATVGAFIYNICSDLVGGIEVTLAERD
jgi:hypothetical protein